MGGDLGEQQVAWAQGVWGSGGPSFKEGPVARVISIVRFLIQCR